MGKSKGAPRRSAERYQPEQLVLLGTPGTDTQVEIEIGKTSTKGWKLLEPLLRIIRVNGPMLRGAGSTALPAVEVYVPTFMSTFDLGRGDKLSSSVSPFMLEGKYSNVKIHGESTLAQMLLSDLPEGTSPKDSYASGAVVCLVTVAPISVYKGSAKRIKRSKFRVRLERMKKRLKSKRLSHAHEERERDTTLELVDTINRQLDMLGAKRAPTNELADRFDGVIREVQAEKAAKADPSGPRRGIVRTKPLRRKAGRP